MIYDWNLSDLRGSRQVDSGTSTSGRLQASVFKNGGELWIRHGKSDLVDQHLSDGRQWILGGDAPTFSDITMATAIAFSKFPVNVTPLDERFEHLDAFWLRWQRRPSFRSAYADRSSGVPELDDPRATEFL